LALYKFTYLLTYLLTHPSLKAMSGYLQRWDRATSQLCESGTDLGPEPKPGEKPPKIGLLSGGGFFWREVGPIGDFGI